jgi:hypothetical protein
MDARNKVHASSEHSTLDAYMRAGQSTRSSLTYEAEDAAVLNGFKIISISSSQNP